MRRWFALFIIGISIATELGAQPIEAVNLRCNYRINPLGIDESQPILTWEIKSESKNVLQSAYRIIVSDDPSLIAKGVGNIWDSKKVSTNPQGQVYYEGSPLQSAKKYYWRVMIWDKNGRSSSYSKTAYWQMGLLDKKDWDNAHWIAYDILPDSNIFLPLVHGNGKKEWGKRPNVLPLFRKTITIKKTVKSATAFICGLGQFEMYVNGNKTGDHFLDPGWTQYSKHAQYVTFDVTNQIRKGENAIGVWLGNGFYYIPGERYRKMTGAYGYPKLIAKFFIEYADGSSEAIVTDSTWKTSASPIYFSSIYGGEDYDANLEQPKWNEANFKDASWKNAVETDGPSMLHAQLSEPLKVFEQFTPVSRRQLKQHVWVFDLGQNFSGIPSITVSGRKGDTVRIIPAELLNDDGSVNQKGSGGLHVYTYVLKGDGQEQWQPRFTYYGFRYLQVENAVPDGITLKEGAPLIKDIRGLHIRNAAPLISHFSCSNELFNKTHALILWAIKSNMVSVYTDCPHREKLGWLEQTHLMGSSVQYNFDIAALNRKVIRDMMYAQYPDGKIPEIAPEYTRFTPPFDESPEWGSAAVILPWYHYLWFGDKKTLAEAYDMMKRYVAYLQNKSSDHILSHGLGDWFDIGPNRPGVAQLTPQGITATAIYYYDITILEKTATLLGKVADATRYRNLAAEVKVAFNKKFFNQTTKQYATGSQTANAMALYMGLVEERYQQDVLHNLITDIEQRGFALTAGDIGYRYVLRVLEKYGRNDVIYRMNNRSDVPGYGYQITHGATALTESWQAYPFVSNNHFMLGHLMEWLYSGLCGIRQVEGSVAFRTIEIRPQPVGDIKEAKAHYRSIQGIIAVAWKKDKERFSLEVSIPSNTTATIFFPEEYKKKPVKVGSGEYKFIVSAKKRLRG